MTTIKFKRGTSTRWTSVNPVLAAGEPGYDTTNKKFKIGDGTSTWTQLPFQDTTYTPGTAIGISDQNAISVKFDSAKGLAVTGDSLGVRVDGTTIDFDASGNLKAIGGGGGTTYTAAYPLDIDGSNEISLKIDSNTLKVNTNNELEVIGGGGGGGLSPTGSATQPIYIDANGDPQATTYELNKTVPSDAVFTDTTYTHFTGATSLADGSAGLVPAPIAGDQTKFLCADGTWQNVSGGGGTYTAGDGMELIGDAFSVAQGVVEHFTVVGTPTFTGHVISGFSDSNYLTSNNYLNNISSSFELVTAINMSTASNNNLGICDALDHTAHGIRLTTSSTNTVHLRISTTGAETYAVDITGTTTLTVGTKVFIKVTYDSTTGYELLTSLDGNTWTSEGTSSTTTKPYSGASSYLRWGDNAATGLSLTGSIYLDDTYVKVDGVKVWQPYTGKEAAVATNSLFGLIKPDNGTIEVNNGILSTALKINGTKLVSTNTSSGLGLKDNFTSLTPISETQTSSYNYAGFSEGTGSLQINTSSLINPSYTGNKPGCTNSSGGVSYNGTNLSLGAYIEAPFVNNTMYFGGGAKNSASTHQGAMGTFVFGKKNTNGTLDVKFAVAIDSSYNVRFTPVTTIGSLTNGCYFSSSDYTPPNYYAINNYETGNANETTFAGVAVDFSGANVVITACATGSSNANRYRYLALTTTCPTSNVDVANIDTVWFITRNSNTTYYSNSMNYYKTGPIPTGANNVLAAYNNATKVELTTVTNRYLGLNVGSGLTTSGGNLIVDYSNPITLTSVDPIINKLSGADITVAPNTTVTSGIRFTDVNDNLLGGFSSTRFSNGIQAIQMSAINDISGTVTTAYLNVYVDAIGKDYADASAGAKSTIAGWSMPKTGAKTLLFTQADNMNGVDFTNTTGKNGYLYVTSDAAATGSHIIYVKNQSLPFDTTSYGQAGFVISAFVPVAVGQTCQFFYLDNGGTGGYYVYFIETIGG